MMVPTEGTARSGSDSNAPIVREGRGGGGEEDGVVVVVACCNYPSGVSTCRLGGASGVFRARALTLDVIAKRYGMDEWPQAAVSDQTNLISLADSCTCGPFHHVNTTFE